MLKVKILATREPQKNKIYPGQINGSSSCSLTGRAAAYRGRALLLYCFLFRRYERRKKIGTSWKDEIQNRLTTRFLFKFDGKSHCGQTVLTSSYPKPGKTQKTPKTLCSLYVPSFCCFFVMFSYMFSVAHIPPHFDLGSARSPSSGRQCSRVLG